LKAEQSILYAWCYAIKITVIKLDQKNQ